LEVGLIQLEFDSEQLWTIHEFVRHQRGAPEYGAEWGEEFAVRLWQGIVELAEKDRGSLAVVGFEPYELKLVTRQISAQLMVGSRVIGREILLKAMTALLGLHDEASQPYSIPSAFDVDMALELVEEDGRNPGTHHPGD
jgi:hypothetical protein